MTRQCLGAVANPLSSNGLATIVLGLMIASGRPSGAAADSNFPPGLSGKSAVIAWSEVRVQRPEGDSDFQNVAADMTISLYFSTQGHVFGRVTPKVNGRSGDIDRRVGDALAPTIWAINFSGTSATFFTPYPGGGAVRKVEIAFNSAFSSCAAQIAYGKRSADTLIRAWSPISHSWVEQRSITVDPADCSVRDGSVFADGTANPEAVATRRKRN
jgi:hypothetical protein